MAVLDLYESKEHSTNFAHFAAIAYLTCFEKKPNADEERVLKNLSKKLAITPEEFSMILSNPQHYPIPKVPTTEKRLHRIFDLFKIIFADHEIDDHEKEFVNRYAVEIGFSPSNVNKVIDRSIKLFSGNFDFDEYSYFIKKQELKF